MLRTIACCSVLLLAFPILLNYGCAGPTRLHINLVCDNDTTKVTYFNLNGNAIKYCGNTRPNLNIVITDSNDSITMASAIDSNKVIDLPSPEVMNIMKKQFEWPKSNDPVEQLFFVARAGTISDIVKGTIDEVDSIQKSEAGESLKIKSKKLYGSFYDTIPAYSVHTHWKEPFPGEIDHKACPSKADKTPGGFGYKTRVFVILGYEQEDSVGMTICEEEAKGHVAKGVKYVPTICFYDSTGDIKRIKFSAFEALVKNIHSLPFH